MLYGAKCPKCGLIQLPNPTCKTCGTVLEAPSETPRRTSSRSPSRSLARNLSTIPPGVSQEDRVPKTAIPGKSWCSECGMLLGEDELIRIGDALVCAGCKPLFVQKLREGVTVAGEMVYAGFWIRVGAKFIDGIVLSVVTLALGFAGNLVTSNVIASSILQNILSFVLSVGYVTYFLGAYSATPGKMACGLRVVRPDGEKISYARACGRCFAEFVSSLILGIGYLMVIFDEEKRALHDRICDTRVVKKA